ncbi:MAG: amidohydrolase family protein [Candidatus Methylacidiphilales bacterium]|nr:amidohydrolase family protein [Candidatus Methylacidiphilales bacterium]
MNAGGGMTIDAHQHFWRYSADEYGWIDDAMAHIRRDFLPEDLETEMRGAGVDGVVSVQARTSVEETTWLLEQAVRHPWICGVVGWLPLAEATLQKELDRFAGHPKLKAVREVMQGRPPGALLEPAFSSGVARLREYGLAYDILIFARQLEEAAAFVDRHPGQVFVLDHIAKPDIRGGGMDAWARGLRDLARRPDVYCKVSGLVTEAEWKSWTPDSLRPYWEVVLEAFGPSRLMFGSDWPVCLVACGYGRWKETVCEWIGKFSADEQNRVLGGTAVEAYRLEKQP